MGYVTPQMHFLVVTGKLQNPWPFLTKRKAHAMNSYRIPSVYKNACVWWDFLYMNHINMHVFAHVFSQIDLLCLEIEFRFGNHVSFILKKPQFGNHIMSLWYRLQWLFSTATSMMLLSVVWYDFHIFPSYKYRNMFITLFTSELWLPWGFHGGIHNLTVEFSFIDS